MTGRVATLVTLATLVTFHLATAVPPEAVEPGRDWRVRAVEIRGNHEVVESKLTEAMLTKPRPWYRFWEFWKPRPAFDPIVFRDDVDRVRQIYRNEGFYHARVSADVVVPPDGELLDLVVDVVEGPPVHVTSVDVELTGEALPAKERDTLLASLPVKRGAVFKQEDYARTATTLQGYYREHGFARVKLERAATVDVRDDTAAVRYHVASGPPSVFGAVEIVGTAKVDPDVVRKEVAFEPGDPFRQSLLDETHRRIVATRLFRTVKITDTGGDDPVVGTRIEVSEGPAHEVALGIGYDTEEQIRGIASWRSYNFFGGGRQLGFLARASFINRTVAVDFVQPHVPRQGDRVRVTISEAQEEEESYTDDRSRLSPRVEFRALPYLTTYAFYRIEYDSLSKLNDRVHDFFPDLAPKNSLLSGLGFGVDLNTTDDLLDPHRGWAASLGVEPVGGFLGGDFTFVRLLVDARRYQPLPGDFTLALRTRVGFADPYGGTKDVPLFERFYAGGIDSVRGYERRHVGPMVEGDPIGGLSLVEGSIELRHPITEAISGAVFFDAGQVTRQRFHLPIDELRYGAGVGAAYKTPVGPLRVDLGFPFDAPHGDASWQIHVSIGQTF
jgi:outer membrane protein assembly complex protein YaeT